MKKVTIEMENGARIKAELYPEIAPFAGQCRYDNCRHIKEPECAVRAAVESGEISQQRYDSYKTQLEEIQQKNRY